MLNKIETMVAEMNAFSEDNWFNRVLPEMRARYSEEHVESFISANLNRRSYSYQTGRKFARIMMHDYGREETTGSMVWFVNMETGDIHKGNGWKGASKYVRGHIDNWKAAMSFGSSSGVYGFISIR
ncbi:hypothetical protein [Aeromonas phage AS-yj]|uniref:Uncharacterized protein n=2 Tax=Ceceduovirus aszj TaxID=2843652 RepID=A0A291LD61_9CAUD|nr:hypothetical protein [Aeromonas phage AS-szw]ATI17752.1 hypothetical protein [Aeromonas phage AS-yj]